MKQLLAVYQSGRWIEYLTSRLHDYLTCICSIQGSNVKIASAQLVLPASFDLHATLEHDFEHRIFEPIPDGQDGWQFRDDAYILGAERLMEMSKKEGKYLLICPSEYSKPTDGVLKKRPHIIERGQVHLISDLRKETFVDAAKVMRQARSSRTFAVLSDDEYGLCKFLHGGIFCTDVFDGDALVICKLE